MVTPTGLLTESAVQVSTLITSYNHEPYIAQALDSVLAQVGIEGHEILVGDDCSTDGSRTVIETYARRYPDVIRPVFPATNLGTGGKALYRLLVAQSRGRYIAGLDGDDYWTSPHKLFSQVAHLEAHPECSMCFHNVVHDVQSDGPDILHNAATGPPATDLSYLIEHNPVASCSPVFRSDSIRPLPQWYMTLPWGDWPLYILAAMRGEIHFIPEVMGAYRIHEGGMYSRLSRRERLRLEVEFFEGLVGVVGPAEPRRRARLAATLVELGREELQAGDRVAADRALRRSFAALPFDRRTWHSGNGERRRLVLWLSLRSGLRQAPGRPHPTWGW